jgi:dTDP-4-amino-4,6-dideoxygalactose transaminase
MSFVENIKNICYYSNTMAQGVHKITEDFEKALSDYTGAPYVIALDNMSNALFLALYYEKNIKKSLKDIRQFRVK